MNSGFNWGWGVGALTFIGLGQVSWGFPVEAAVLIGTFLVGNAITAWYDRRSRPK